MDMMRFWWHGERDDEPLLLPVEPGTKQLVTVQLLVNADDADQATTLVGDLLRRAETPRTGGPVIDWRFVSQTPYRLAAEYEEGDAFSPANSAATVTDKTTWYCKLCYGTFWTDPAERILSRCPYCGGRSWERR